MTPQKNLSTGGFSSFFGNPQNGSFSISHSLSRTKRLRVFVLHGFIRIMCLNGVNTQWVYSQGVINTNTGRK